MAYRNPWDSVIFGIGHALSAIEGIEGGKWK
jgi:hypothetical protein